MSASYENFLIDYALYSQFIKYDELKKLIVKEYKSDNYSKTINVYIDLYQFLMTALRYTKIDDPYVICASMINYAGHMRNYFKTVHNMYSNIILVYSTNDSENNTRFIPEYNSKYNSRKKTNSFMYDKMKINLELLEILIPYIPDVFLKKGSVEPSVIIHHLIQKSYFGKHPNLIISNSQMMYQLPVFSKSAIVIKKDLSYTNGILDRTYSYNNSNCLNGYVYELTKKNLDYVINQNSISFVNILRGIPKRSIKSLFSINPSLIMANKIPLGCEHDPDIQYDIYVNYKSNKSKISKEEYINRYKCIDLGYQYKLYKLLPESKEIKFLEQLEDVNSMHEINDAYFKNSALNLENF